MNDTMALIRNTRRPLGSQIAPGSMVAAGRTSGAILRGATDTPAPVAKGNRTALPAGLDFATVDALLKRVPVGRYALPRVIGDGNDVTFFDVSVRRGAHVIQTLSGAPGDYQTWPMKLHLQYFAATHLLEDLVAATALYGHKAKRCGRCNSPLTRTKSRAQGMGDRCLSERAAGR